MRSSSGKAFMPSRENLENGSKVIMGKIIGR
jgi:hypothetical protein